MGAHRHEGSLILEAQGQSLSVESGGDDGSLQAFHGSLRLFTSTKKSELGYAFYTKETFFYRMRVPHFCA